MNGVIVKKIEIFADPRGWLKEIHRTDMDNLIPAMCYVSHTNFMQDRGPHEHAEQTDFFVFLGPGDFELYIWDNRKDSSTYGNKDKLIVGQSNNVSVLVPPGVVHGYKSITPGGSFSINLPDKLYAGFNKKEPVDEIRHENETESKFRMGSKL